MPLASVSGIAGASINNLSIFSSFLGLQHLGQPGILPLPPSRKASIAYPAIRGLGRSACTWSALLIMHSCQLLQETRNHFFSPGYSLIGQSVLPALSRATFH